MTEIVLDRVGKQFTIDGRAVDAVTNVSLTFASGSFTALIGPSGCGKSTLAARDRRHHRALVGNHRD